MNINNLKFEVLKRALIGSLDEVKKQSFLSNSLLESEILTLSKEPISDNRFYGKDWPSNAETMIGYERLSNLQNCIIDVIKNNIEGDFIETGVWRGGACILAKIIIDEYKSDKKVFVADSFEGLPKPNVEKYPKDFGDCHHTFEALKISLEEVKNNFKKYNSLDENVIFLKGWFKNTLPSLDKNQKFSIIRLDGDMYESTMDSFENLYSKLMPGGYVIIDDFCLKPCVEATHDFRKINNITEPIQTIDFTGVFWQKNKI